MLMWINSHATSGLKLTARETTGKLKMSPSPRLGRMPRRGLKEICNILKRSRRNVGWVWDSHSGGYEEWDLLGFNVLQFVEAQWHFEGTYRLHLQGRRIHQARNKQESGVELIAGFSLVLFFDTEYGDNTFLRNVSRLLLNYTALQPRGFTLQRHLWLWQFNVYEGVMFLCSLFYLGLNRENPKITWNCLYALANMYGSHGC
jgi:hypothetical protein